MPMLNNQRVVFFGVTQISEVTTTNSIHSYPVARTKKTIFETLSSISKQIWVWINTYRYIFSGMNIHLPAILMFTRGTRVLTHPHFNHHAKILTVVQVKIGRLSASKRSQLGRCRKSHWWKMSPFFNRGFWGVRWQCVKTLYPSLTSK